MLSNFSFNKKFFMIKLSQFANPQIILEIILRGVFEGPKFSRIHENPHP